jgi:hypothetical protein
MTAHKYSTVYNGEQWCDTHDSAFPCTVIDAPEGFDARNGNPRYRLTFDDGTSAPLQPDSSIAYGINNPEYRSGPVRVTFNGRGHVTYVKTVKED